MVGNDASRDRPDNNNHESDNSRLADKEVGSSDNVAVAHGRGSLNKWMVDANARKWNKLKEKDEGMADKHTEKLVE